MHDQLNPPVLTPEEKAMELMRIWLVDNKLRVVITPNLWNDPAPWGLLLADLIRHLGNAYEEKGYNRSEIIKRIKELLDVEWESPTSEAKKL